MAVAKLNRAGNELGANTTYQIFLDKEGVPAVRAFHIEDINQVELYPWARMGGRGVYLNLEGSEGVNDCYICEVPPGKSLEPQKHMFEELVFVVSGRGATTVWQEAGKKQTFEWGEGGLFSSPRSTTSAGCSLRSRTARRACAATSSPGAPSSWSRFAAAFHWRGQSSAESRHSA